MSTIPHGGEEHCIRMLIEAQTILRYAPSGRMVEGKLNHKWEDALPLVSMVAEQQIVEATERAQLRDLYDQLAHGAYYRWLAAGDENTPSPRQQLCGACAQAQHTLEMRGVS